jgi:hypothetical protein
MGGLPGGPVDRSQHEVEDWERLADAISSALSAKGLQSTLLVEKSILTTQEIDEKTAEIERRWGAS